MYEANMTYAGWTPFPGTVQRWAARVALGACGVFLLAASAAATPIPCGGDLYRGCVWMSMVSATVDGTTAAFPPTYQDPVLASSLAAGPESPSVTSSSQGSGSATAAGSVSIPSLGGNGSAVSNGAAGSAGFGASFAVENGFYDAATFAVGTYAFVVGSSNDSVTVSGTPLSNARVTASAELVAAPLSGQNNPFSYQDIFENVCITENNGGPAGACNSGYSTTPYTAYGPAFTVTSPGTTIIFESTFLLEGATDGWLGGSSSASASFSDPGFYIQVLTPGGSYTSASGVSYTLPSAIPEPSAWGLLGLAALLLVVARQAGRAVRQWVRHCLP